MTPLGAIPDKATAIACLREHGICHIYSGEYAPSDPAVTDYITALVKESKAKYRYHSPSPDGIIRVRTEIS